MKNLNYYYYYSIGVEKNDFYKICETIASINSLLTKIADITASHEAGYISRWRTLIIDEEIEHLKRLMGTLDHRFKLMCNIRQVVND